jgi:flagellar hook assembly protein FlgD
VNETAYERLISALRAHGCKVVERSGERASATCPHHEDTDPSCSVTGIAGQALVHCHKGCDYRDVLAALDMVPADLYDDRKGADYRYADGLVAHRRYQPNGKKKFWQDNAGKQTVLYHLDRLADVGPDQYVYLVEGEKDVHAIEAAGGVATTAPGGADSFSKVDVSPLAGRLVVCVVDRPIKDDDVSGDKWAAQVHAKLQGVARDHKFVRSAAGKDAADHIAAGLDFGDFERYEPPGVSSETPEPAEPSHLERLRAALVDTDGLDGIPDPEPLIGEDILFRDGLAWMVGKPGCGKSFTALDMAGCVATGEHWQGYPVSEGPVLYLVAEGVRGIKKRVRAWETSMGQRMTGVQFLPVAVQSKNGAQWAALVELARELQPVLIVIDTQARVTVGVEENSNTEMGEFVHQAERLRAASAACVLIVHHIGRNGDTGRGATTLDGALSTVIKVTKDDDRVKLECQKNKDGAEWDPIDLRAVPTGESLVLMVSDGTHTKPANMAPKWVREWWATFEDEAVSVATLVKANVVSETTFHRTRLALIKAGVIYREGHGNATRYKLPGAPALT